MDRRTLIAVALSVVVIVGSLLVQTFLFPGARRRVLGLGGAPAAGHREPRAGQQETAADARDGRVRARWPARWPRPARGFRRRAAA